MGLTQVLYFHSHMHQCLTAQCQEKTWDMSQQDKILAGKSFAREEEKLPLQAASKFMLSSNNPSTNFLPPRGSVGILSELLSIFSNH